MMLKFCVVLFILGESLSVDVIFHVPEGHSPGTFIGNIADETHFLDSMPPQEHGSVTFSQLHESISEDFELFNITNSGKMYTTQILDAESLCKYNSECFKMVEIAVRHEESFVRILEIKIIIDDINDNAPEFSSKQIKLQFSETDREGFMKSIPNALDKDVSTLYNQINYQLYKNLDEPFSLSVNKKVDGTAKIGIMLEEALDRELKDSYTLQVIARDGGSPPKEGILDIQISVTDENDNSPSFSQDIYNVSINNGFRKDIPVFVLHATDLDSGKNGEILYQFGSKTSPLAKSHFTINEKTGEIFQSRTNYGERKQMYKLYIEAIDNGNPPLSSTAIVLINILNEENNAPRIDMKFVSKFEGNRVTISEGVKVGSFIAYVKVIDNDVGLNGEVSCQLEHDKLELRSLGTNKYKVVIKNTVNRESQSQLNFAVECEDKGMPPLLTKRMFTVQVKDVNDIQPHFTRDVFKFLTYENEKPNFPIGLINATDQDQGSGGRLSFSLLNDHNHALPFKISNFGFIVTTQMLDREQQDIYKFKVLVKDNGIPPLSNTATVIVEVMDKNDNAPYFTFPSVSPFTLDVHYHPQSNSDITTLRASDRDSHVNAFLKYEILSGNGKQLFTVNPYTGTLSYYRTVYQNDAGLYDLQFVVKDSGTPVLSATTILSLTLTVSNNTSKMFTPIGIEADKKIHFNLVAVIVIAAVIVSVAIVVSIAICIIQKNNQRKFLYTNDVGGNNKFAEERRPSEYVSETVSPQYDISITMVSDNSMKRNTQTATLKKESLPRHKPGQNWKNSPTGILHQNIIQGTHQEATVTSGVNKEEEHMLMVHDHFNEIPTLSNAESGTGWNEENTVHYETLAALKSCNPDQPKIMDDKSSQKTLNKPMFTNSTTKCSYQHSPGQNTTSNDVIDLKSFRVNSTNPNITPQSWNLPTRNSFTSYAKPLPAIPKTICS
ncbi:protocadherin beta-13-like isoform X1 [Octopus sinensis]|nr:protocadherin beta-13-like isoform X1 [Octopus sinensis]